ncbi:MAG: PD40 domain-containing protein [Clostridia bacterium]|nr:PD40 domain-containing protein [Clostridia bacterium]
MKQKILISVGFLLILLANVPLFATQGGWTYLGDEYYSVVFDGEAIVYNALQEEDMQKISDEIEKKPSVVEKWQGKRPEMIAPLNIRFITARNVLNDVAKPPFIVTFDEFGETKAAELIANSFEGETILTPADPEYSSLPMGLIMSPNKKKYLIPTNSGMWLLENGENQAVKISKDTYKGKNIGQLAENLAALYPDIDGPFIIWWNNDPKFSPDSSKIVFTTNRDFERANGMSVWVYDFATSLERPIVSIVDKEYYLVKGWVGNDHLIVERFNNHLSNYYLVDMAGNLTELNLEGANPSLIATHSNGFIAYSPDASTYKDLYISKVDVNNQGVSTLAEIILDGPIIINSITFNPSGTKVSYITSRIDSRFRNLNVFDLNLLKEIDVNQRNLKGDLIGGEAARWIGDDRLIVYAEKMKNNMVTISTWIYSLKGEM